MNKGNTSVATTSTKSAPTKQSKSKAAAQAAPKASSKPAAKAAAKPVKTTKVEPKVAKPKPKAAKTAKPKKPAAPRLDKYQRQLTDMLRAADVRIGGSRSQDMVVNDSRLYKRVFAKGTLGVGESYMDGWWDARKLDVMVTNVLTRQASNPIRAKQVASLAVKARLFNMQSRQKAYKNARAHYDIGNDLYESMLGSTMAYSCAYWEWGAKTLDKAQQDKFDLIAKKLKLKRGMKVLDIGCGWGGLATHLAKKYGCTVVGITPSREQEAYAKQHSKGLKAKFQLTTWEDFKPATTFDRIVTVGMLEHVGVKNYRRFMQAMQGWLKDDGLLLVHSIGGNESVQSMDPWLNKYIFPGSMLPSVQQLAAASEGLFVMEDWHNMGANYDKTLMSWYRNFRDAYPKLDHTKYDERFKRMWEFYLLTCAALFRSRETQLWQIVYSKHGVPGGYKPIR